METSIVYTAGAQNSAKGKEVRVLGIEYEVQLVGNKAETAVNVTSHL